MFGAVAPAVGGKVVLAIAVEDSQPLHLVGTHELGQGPAGERKVVVDMPVADGIRLARFGKVLQRVLANRLEQMEALAVGVRGDQRFLHQVGEQLEHGNRLLDFAAAANRFGRLERPAAGEHRQAPQQGALGRGQEFVAPLDGGAQRLLPRHRRRIAAGEQAEAVVEALGDLLHRERAHPCGGKLDGERNAVQALADLADGGGVGRRRAERAVGGTCTIDEELDRLRRGHRRHQVDGLALHVQRLAARGEDLQVRAGLQQAPRHVGRALQEVLAVVEHAEQALARNRLGERLDDGLARFFGDTQHEGDDVGHAPLVCERRQLHEPDAVGKFTHQLARHLQRQPRLSGAARAGERDQARDGEQRLQLRDLVFAADEGAEGRGQIVAARPQGVPPDSAEPSVKR